MLTENVINTGSIAATTAIAKQRFVNYVGGQATDGQAVLGVAGDDVVIGEQTPVKTRGWIVVTAGAAVAVGANVQSDAQGRAITLAAGQNAGRALDAATAAGQLIRVDR
jgi:hypothetical protein